MILFYDNFNNDYIMIIQNNKYKINMTKILFDDVKLERERERERERKREGEASN